MKAVVAAFNQEKALVRAFSVIVQPVVEPMDRFAALVTGHHQPSNDQSHRNNIITLPYSGVKKLCIAAVFLCD